MSTSRVVKKDDNEKAYKGLVLTKKQKNFLIALDASALNVSVVLKKMGMSRSQYDLWMRTVEDFKLCVSHIEESQNDWAETKLKQNIANNHQGAIEYFLNAKAKHRGYGQKIDIKTTNTTRRAELAHLSDEELERMENEMVAKVQGKSKK